MGTGSRSSFGPYEIRALLGRGGMGEVYRAWDPRLQREVALKILRERSETDPARVQRFVAEARAASALNHPNIITVFDAAVDGATPYIVSELIDGEPLRDQMRRGPVPIKRLLDIATQIADGLSEAHGAGIVHRDLKPENIMVTRAGRVKILDFGLAGHLGFGHAMTGGSADESQGETALGLRPGTVPYMSPEQARGTAAGLHSDQFSFGLVLYEMLTGRPAFHGATPAATLHAIVNADPPISALDARAPLPLRWVVERCLTKNPEERYAATADLHRELKTIRDRLPEAMARETATARPGARPRWPLVAMVAAIIGAFVGAIALPDALGGGERIDLSALHFTPLATEAGFEGFPAWAPSGELIAYSAEVGGVLQIFTRQRSSSTSAQVTYGPFDCKYPFWSPDGKRIYYVSLAQETEGIWSVGAAGGTPHVVVTDAIRGAISPDGRTLAFLRDEQAGDIVSGAALWLSAQEGPEPWTSDGVEAAAKRYEGLGAVRFVEGALSFAPDGSRLGLSAVPRTIDLPPEARGWQFWIIPLRKGDPYRRFQWWSDAAPRVTSFSWLPDGRHVVLGATSLATPGSDLWIADLEADRAWPLTRSPDSEYYPSSSPTGDAVVFTRDESDYDVVTIPIAPGTAGSAAAQAPLAQPLIATARNESEPAWSSDGNVLAYVTDRSGQEEIWLRSREGEQWVERPFITQRDFGDDRTIMLGAPAFSPDGRQIAYLRNAQKPIWPLRIWVSLTDGGATVPLLPPSHEGFQSAPTWSPDGQWIAYTQWRGQESMLVKVRVGSNAGPEVLRTDGVPNAAPQWSPRNDWITWETGNGIVLVSPDGKAERTLPGGVSDDRWLFHAWSRDGSRLVGITETDDHRLSLVDVDARSGSRRALADLGVPPPVNNPVKGLSVSPDGRSVVISTVRLRGDLWLLDGLRVKRGLWGFLLSKLARSGTPSGS
jgi:Tol biopolymer transport system component